MAGKQQVLILVADKYEDLELHYPRFRLIEAGIKVVVGGEKEGHVYESKHGYPAKADLSFDMVKVNEFDALLIPGGYAPDTLRAMPRVLEITRQFHEAKKLIAYICHAGWVPASAGVIKGIKCTSYGSIKDDMVNAGGLWSDAPVIVDKNFISSRCPDDLPVYCQAILKHLAAK